MKRWIACLLALLLLLGAATADEQETYHSEARRTGSVLQRAYEQIDGLNTGFSFYHNLVDEVIRQQSGTMSLFGVEMPSWQALAEGAYKVLDRTDWEELRRDLQEQIIEDYLAMPRYDTPLLYGLMLSEQAQLMQEFGGLFTGQNSTLDAGWGVVTMLKDFVVDFMGIENTTDAEKRFFAYLAADTASSWYALDAAEKLLGGEFVQVCRDMKQKLLEAANEEFTTIMDEDAKARSKAIRKLGENAVSLLAKMGTDMAVTHATAYVQAVENMAHKYGETLISTQPAIWTRYTMAQTAVSVGQGVSFSMDILLGIRLGNLITWKTGRSIDAKHAMIAMVPLEVSLRGTMLDVRRDAADRSEDLYTATNLLLCARRIGLEHAMDYVYRGVTQNQIIAMANLQGEKQKVENLLATVEAQYARIGEDQTVDYLREIRPDGSVIITRYLGDRTRITIPAMLDGRRVTAIGERAFHRCKTLEGVTVPPGIREIGKEAFAACTKLERIALPDTLTTIGDYAFTDCDRLQEIYLPAGVTQVGANPFRQLDITVTLAADHPALMQLEGMLYSQADMRLIYCPRSLVSEKAAVIPAGTKIIGDSAMYDCYMTSLSIPDSVTTIGARAFEMGFNLTELFLPDSVTEIGESAFSDCQQLTKVRLPASLTELGAGAFSACRALTDIPLPAGLKRIGDYAFNRCTALTALTFPASLETIGEGAYGHCTGLTAVDFSTGPATIGHTAFTECTGLTGLHFSGNVKTLHYGAFLGCTGLTSVTFDFGVEQVLDASFQDCTGLTEITLPDSVTRLGGSAFEDCTGLTRVHLSDNILRLESGTFLKCRALTEIHLPARLQRLGGLVGCSSLTSIDIPAGVTSIDSFENCSALTGIVIPAGVTHIPFQCFEGCDELRTVTLPEGLLQIDKAAFLDSGVRTINLPASIRNIGYYALPDSATAIVEPGSYAESWCRINGIKTKYPEEPTPTPTPEPTPTPAPTATPAPTPEGEEWVEYTPAPNLVSGDWEYRWSDWLHGMEIRKYTGTDAHVVVPDTLGGQPVVAIYSSAFSQNDTLRSVEIPESVTYLYSGAFFDCRHLQRVKLPAGLGEVRQNPFDNCEALTDIDVSGNPRLFLRDGVLYSRSEYNVVTLLCYLESRGTKSFTVPNDVWTIGYQAFCRVDGLEEVILSDRLYEIGGSAFFGCADLKRIHLGKRVKSIGTFAFDACHKLVDINFPASLETIGFHAFQSCTGLQEVVLPEGLKELGSSAFSYCLSLERVTLPSTLAVIEESAFSRCHRLTEIVIPEGVTSLLYEAFEGCTYLNCITLPASLTTLEEPFNRCPNVTVVVKPGSAAEAYCQSQGIPCTTGAVKPRALSDYSDSRYAYCLNKNGTAVVWRYFGDEAHLTVPSVLDGRQVTSIEQLTFSGKDNLRSVVIPEGVTYVGAYAFSVCRNLERVSLPASVGQSGLGSNPFTSCDSLREINLAGGAVGVWLEDGVLFERSPYWGVTLVTYPTGLKADSYTVPATTSYIGDSAFVDADHLRRVVIPATVTRISEYAFSGCTNMTAVVTQGSYAETYCREQGIAYTYGK